MKTEVKTYLENMAAALTDGISITCADKCGHCHKQRIAGKIARRVLALGAEVTLKEFHDAAQKVWARSKYVRAYNAARSKGLNHEGALKELARKGWQP